MAARIKFIYLAFGPKPSIALEFKYAVAALLAEFPQAAGDIAVFTDRPALYAGNDEIIEIIDISQDVAEITLQGRYHFRAKPHIVLRALRRFDCACVFMDADSFVEPGFARAIDAQMKRGEAVMNRYVRSDPYPQLAACAFELPSGKTYHYDPATALMYNSGMIAVQPRHAPALEDAIALIDQLWDWPVRAHDIEQFALNETLRLHGFAIADNDRSFVHYHRHWRKRYMHWRLAQLPHLADSRIVARRPAIRLSRLRTRLFKRYAIAGAWVARARGALGAAGARLSEGYPRAPVLVAAVVRSAIPASRRA
jgi:hypothetical protein